MALGGVLATASASATSSCSAPLIATSARFSAGLIAPGVRGSAPPESARAAEMLLTLRDPRFAALVFGLAIPASVLFQAYISYLVAPLRLLPRLDRNPPILMIFFLAALAAGPLGGRLAEAGVPAGLTALNWAALAGTSLVLVSTPPGISPRAWRCSGPAPAMGWSAAPRCPWR